MTRFFYCLVLFVCLGVAPAARAQQTTAAAAQQSSTVQELEKLTSRFFALLITGDSRSALSELLKNSPIADNNDQLQQLVVQTEKTVTLYGTVQGYELVSTDVLAQSFVRLRYIALHDDYPVRWILTYYKSPSKGWLVTNVRFDDRAEELFQDQE